MPTRQRLLLVLVLAFSLLVLLACGEEDTPTPAAAPRAIILTTDDSPVATPVAVSLLPTPIPFQFPNDLSTVQAQPGKAVVIGRLISTITGQPIANTHVRMAEIFYAEGGNKDPNQAAWALDNAFSPYAASNADGYFIFDNVEPTDFVLFVGDVINRYTVETNENERPVPRSAPADVITDLGDIRVNY